MRVHLETTNIASTVSRTEQWHEGHSWLETIFLGLQGFRSHPGTRSSLEVKLLGSKKKGREFPVWLSVWSEVLDGSGKRPVAEMGFKFHRG